MNRGIVMTKLVALPPLVALFFVLVSGTALAGDPRWSRAAVEEAAGPGISPGEFLGGEPFTPAAADTYCIVWYTFETMSWQGWTRERWSGPFGPFSGLAGNLADKDPCGEDLWTQIVFFIGSDRPSTRYFGLFETPSCAITGSSLSWCQDEVAVSPVIDLARYSTGCNQFQDAVIPSGDAAALGGCSLRFSVYRDLPFRNLVFYVWRVRNVGGGRAGEWLDRGLLYYGDGADYMSVTESIGDLVAGDSIQVAVGVVDMCEAWYSHSGECADHTPSPWFDNVRVYRYKSSGPQWSYRDIDLFQDNFPSESAPPWGTVRADAARDINSYDNPSIRPGDSIVVSCGSPLGGGIAAEGGRPAVYLHVMVRWAGAGNAPLGSIVSGAQLQGSCGAWLGTAGTWDIIQCDSARADGSVTPGKYMVDLNDSLLMPGYEIYYFFTARDVLGGETSLPRWSLTTSPYFEFTCLPTGTSDMLFVDDCSGRGSFYGIVEDCWNPVLGAVIPASNWPDRYDVNGPSSGASNGLGGRVGAELLEYQYNTIIWDSGNLAAFTMNDGATTRDKGNDCGLLVDWLRDSEHSCGLWICGDNVAEELRAAASAPARELMETWCGVTLAEPSYYEATGGAGGGIVTPLVEGDPESGLFVHGGVPDEFLAYGGCPMINRFDCLEKTSDGSYALEYMRYNEGRTYHAGISSCRTNPQGARVKSVWFGFSFMVVRDDRTGPGDRYELANDVFTWMSSSESDRCDISQPKPPAATHLYQNSPNPFDPTVEPTVVYYALKARSFVDIKIYDVTGRLVRTLVRESKETGAWNAPWDGKDNQGVDMPSGLYFCRMRAGMTRATRKIVLVK